MSPIAGIPGISAAPAAGHPPTAPSLSGVETGEDWTGITTSPNPGVSSRPLSTPHLLAHHLTRLADRRHIGLSAVLSCSQLVSPTGVILLDRGRLPHPSTYVLVSDNLPSSPRPPRPRCLQFYLNWPDPCSVHGNWQQSANPPFVSCPPTSLVCGRQLHQERRQQGP